MWHFQFAGLPQVASSSPHLVIRYYYLVLKRLPCPLARLPSRRSGRTGSLLLRQRRQLLPWVIGSWLLTQACGENTVLLGHRNSAGGSGASVTAGTSGNAAIPTSPLLVGAIDLTEGGPHTRLLLGDVTGDGRLDLVTMQPDNVTAGKIPHAVAALTAFDLDGKRLWQVGTPLTDAVASASDIPAQIYDIDGDGENEVLAVMNEQLLTLNGKTGEVLTRHDLPDPDAHDAIIIANFSGQAHPSDLVLKNRFDKLWAFDQAFTQLFAFSGETGYYPWPFDWDGDGKDELFAGGHFLGSDGKERWSCVAATDTTVDSVWAGDLDPVADNGPEVVIGGGDTLGYSATGEQRFAVDTVEAQNLVVGDFRLDLPGLEVAGLDRIDRTAGAGRDGMFLVSAKGEMLWKEQRPAGSGWSTIVSMISNWDGTGRDLVLAYGRADALPTLYDGNFNVITTLPEPDALFMVADICGDDKNELVAYTDGYAHIYSPGSCPMASHITGNPQPQPKSLYNFTRYWGGQVPK